MLKSLHWFRWSAGLLKQRSTNLQFSLVLIYIIGLFFLGAFGRQCRTDDDKVRLLSVVSRSSLSDDAPLLVDESNGSDVDETLRLDTHGDDRPLVDGPCFSGINSATSGQLIDVTDTNASRVCFQLLCDLALNNNVYTEAAFFEGCTSRTERR